MNHCYDPAIAARKGMNHRIFQDPRFPDTLTAEMLADFKTTPRGCTHPRVGVIAGRRYIAKCGSWSADSSDEHVHNEFVADNLLREAGDRS